MNNGFEFDQDNLEKGLKSTPAPVPPPAPQPEPAPPMPNEPQEQGTPL